jgi:hypothetical protein
MTIGSQKGIFKRHGWADNSIIEDIFSATRALVQDGSYSSFYPISLDSTSDNIEDTGMEALAGEFQRLNTRFEPRGKEIVIMSEQEIWKGDPRDLRLMLGEAMNEEAYT